MKGSSMPDMKKTALSTRTVTLLRIVAIVLAQAVALDIAVYIIADRTIPVVYMEGTPVPLFGIRHWVSVILWAGSAFIALSLASLMLLSRFAPHRFLDDRAVDFAFAQSAVVFSACLLLFVVLHIDGNAAARIPAFLGVDVASYQIFEEVDVLEIRT